MTEPLAAAVAKPLSRLRIAAIVAAGALAVSAFLPWITATTGFVNFSKSGIDDGGDGIVVLIAGALAALLVLTGRSGIAFVCGLLAAGVVAWDFNDVRKRVDQVKSDGEFVGSVTIGGGLYLAIVAAIALIVLAWMAHHEA